MTTILTNRKIKPLAASKSVITRYKLFSIPLSATFLLLTFLVHTIFAQTPTGEQTGRTFTNRPPVPVTDNIITNEDVSVSGNLLDNDYDPDGGPVYAVPETKTSKFGTLVIRRDGTYTYTPNPNYHGGDSFTYIVCDYGSPNSCCDGKVKILVNSIQDAPVGNPDVFSTNEDSPLNSSPGSVLKNDIETDGESITAVIGKPPLHGTIKLNQDGTFTYQPELNFNGTDTFTYYANDGVGNSGETLVTITVVPVNDIPIAVNDAISTNEDTPVNIALLYNDSDADDLLVVSMIVIVTQPAHGTLDINATTGTVTYRPTLNFNGNDSFTYKIKDTGGAISNIAVVTITVNPVNDAPMAAPDLATTPEDTPVVISVLKNDADSDNALDVGSVSVVTGPAHGSVVVQAAGTISYTPAKDYNGKDTFTYTVNDAGGTVSIPGIVTITVTPVNDAPVAVGDEITTNENSPVNIPVLANDFDVDNTIVITSVKITTLPQHGTVTLSTTGVVTYTPAVNFSGQDYFTYTIQDQGGLVSTPAAVSITVFNVNLPPVAVDDGPILHESVSALTIDVLDNDYDPDNAHGELSIVSVSNPTSGSVSIVDGQIVFQPNGVLSATVTFTYTITDPEGLTDDAIVTIQYSYIEITVSQGFSPNGDGNNDTWFILGIEYHTNNLVKVFNRSGLQVYQKSGYENIIAPWDGRGNTGQFVGKLVEMGTYFYVLDPGDGLKNLEGYMVIIY